MIRNLRIINACMVFILIMVAIMAFAGCGSERDLSSPEKSLIGHWIEEDEGSEYWFSEDTYITIDHDREYPNVFEIPYEVIRSDKEENWLNSVGDMIIEPQYDNAGIFSEGLVAVKVGEKWGYIDKNGNMIIEPQYADAGYFSEGLAPVKVR